MKEPNYMVFKLYIIRNNKKLSWNENQACINVLGKIKGYISLDIDLHWAGLMF